MQWILQEPSVCHCEVKSCASVCVYRAGWESNEYKSNSRYVGAGRRMFEYILQRTSNSIKNSRNILIAGNRNPMNKQMTRQDFDSFTDEDLVFDIFAHLCDIKQMDEDEKIFLDRLPEPAKFVFLIHVLDAEISNGGFNQYFFNTRCQFIDDTACALTAVSAIKHLNLFNLAVKQMRLQWHIHEENMTSAKSVTELLKNFSSSYDSIELGDEDSNWYKLEDELHSRMVKYIRENAASFIDA